MPSNHWTFGSVQVGLPTDNSPHTVDITIPANATVKKALMKGCALRARDVQLSAPSITPIFLVNQLDWTTGFYAGRNIYYTERMIPWQITVFLATAVTTYNAWYTAGDLELGFDQRMSYGGNGKPASNLRWTWFLDVPAGSFSWVGGIRMQVWILYSLP
jgi:hypothetical protein